MVSTTFKAIYPYVFLYRAELYCNPTDNLHVGERWFYQADTFGWEEKVNYTILNNSLCSYFISEMISWSVPNDAFYFVISKINSPCFVELECFYDPTKVEVGNLGIDEHLLSLDIPYSCKYLGVGQHGMLKEISVHKDNQYFQYDEDKKVVIDRNNNLVLGMNDSLIPESIVSIGDFAFYGCTSLKSIVIPTSVTSLGESAFDFCFSLKDVEIPDSVNVVGDYAFSECRSFHNVIIPDSVISIGNNAFDSCESLQSIVIPDSVSMLGNDMFSDCAKLETIFFNKSGKVHYDEDNYELVNNTPSDVLLGENMLNGCTSFTSIFIPKGTVDYYKHRLPKLLHKYLKELDD